jgi:predicted PurR-regulated permease PerM
MTGGAIGDERRHMPPWVPRLLATIVLVVVGLFVAYHVLSRLRGLVLVLIVALFVSVALEPAVNALARRGWRRGLATWAVFLALLGSLGLLVGLMVPLIVDQVSRLVTRLPEYVERAYGFLGRMGLEVTPDRLAEAVAGIDADLGGFATDLVGSLFGAGQRLLRTIFQLLTIGLFTFYMTADGPRLRRAVCSLLPPGRQVEVLRAWEIAVDKTGGYFYSRALLAAVSAAAGWLVFTIAGVPFPFALAVWMGVVSQFVPVVGTYLGGSLPVLVALLERPVAALVVLGYLVAYQQVENYVLAPRITARTMALHPAVALGSVIAGATLLGVPGALMALPFAATVQGFASTYVHRHEVVESRLTTVPRHGERRRRRPDGEGEQDAEA